MDDVHTWVSEVHGEFFATVAPVPGATQEQVDQVGAALVWVKEGTKRGLCWLPAGSIMKLLMSSVGRHRPDRPADPGPPDW